MPAGSVAGFSVPLWLCPFGLVQVPPVFGEPERLLKRFTVGPFVQTVRFPLPPGSGGCTTLTETVAVAFAQGEVPAAVYVYVPATEVPGVKVPLCDPPPGAVQVPPALGLPPSSPNNWNGAADAQTVVLPLVPAFGACTMFTVTTAVALAHGAGPFTV